MPVAFLLLAALALAMRGITILFPARHEDDGTAVVAAIASSVALISPGARVVQIEEIPCSRFPRWPPARMPTCKF